MSLQIKMKWIKSQTKMRCRKVKNMDQTRLCFQKNTHVLCFFCFSISRENDLVDYGAKNELEDFRFNDY